jgi:hypothetical protein
MSVEKGLFQLVQSNAGIASLVTTTNGNGVYWILAPKAATFPLIVLSRVATDDTIAMAGDLGFRGALFQVDSYAGDFYTSRAVAAAVRELLESYKGTLPDGTVVDAVLQEKDWDFPYEEGSVGFIYRAMQQFRVWYND